MSFEFVCPKCGHAITEAAFEKNEKILNHLSEIFKTHENDYIKELEAKLIAQYKIEQDKEIKAALIAKENELLKINQKQLDQLNQVIAAQKNKIEVSDSELQKTLAQHENKLNQEKNIEFTKLKNQITQLEKTKETQNLILEKTIATKEADLLKENQKELDKLNQIISDQKSKLENSRLELEKTLSQHENKLNQKNHDEIIALREQINQLKDEKKSQKLLLEKFVAEKETEFLKSNQDKVNQLQQIIADQKSKLENSHLELEKTLSQHENKLNQVKHSEILVLKDQIQMLEKANQQFKVIQNKTKGENFEHEIEIELRKTFEPEDVIAKITTQDKKADYLQEVRQDNIVIGKIVYEVKNAEWSNNWEKKLVDDMAKQNSKYGILIATSFNNKYSGIPFKRSDYNPNIYLTDSESFYFVGQILRTLIKIEYRLDNNRDKSDYNEKINQFNEWKANQLPKLDSILNESLTKIDRLADLITDRAQDIKKEKAKIYKTWIKNIKDYLDNFIF